MKNKGIYYSLLLIMAVGITITISTNYFLGNFSSTETKAGTSYEQEMEQEKMLLLDLDEAAVLEELSGGADITRQRRAAEAGSVPKGSGLGRIEADSSFSADSNLAKYESKLIGDVGDNGKEEDNSDLAMDRLGEAGRGALEEEAVSSIASSVPADSDKRWEKEETAAVLISPLETTAVKTNGSTDAGGSVLTDEAVKNSYYRKRLSELELQIQKNRDGQSNSNNSSSAKSLAANELKLWDNELNIIYDEILERLEEKQAGELVEEEREWMKERNRVAVEAAKAFAGASPESVEYTASLAESTRLRAYELVELYGDLLGE